MNDFIGTINGTTNPFFLFIYFYILIGFIIGFFHTVLYNNKGINSYLVPLLWPKLIKIFIAEVKK